MGAASDLPLSLPLPLRALNGGLFVSRGQGQHPTRVIDSHELIFVRAGLLGMFEAEQRFEVRAGETLHLWPGRRHGGTARYPKDLSFYWVHFRLERQPLRGGKRDAPVSLQQHGPVARADRVTELFRLFLEDQESGAQVPALASLLLTALLVEVASGSGRGNTSSGSALATRAEQVILRRFGESLSASAIAAELGCNPDYLGRVFKGARGRTLTAAIHQQRIRQARRLLMDSTLNCDQIAAACGFGDAVYFRRLFRRAAGIPPGAFRRLYGRLHLNTE